uniref:Uncharacterized protein n=1 Tax=Oryza rufipogon TaxID=4529 RepID=A0A0E0N3E6_ORYRU
MQATHPTRHVGRLLPARVCIGGVGSVSTREDEGSAGGTKGLARCQNTSDSRGRSSWVMALKKMKTGGLKNERLVRVA